MAGACNQRPSNGIGHQEMLKVREKIILDQARDKKHQRDLRAEKAQSTSNGTKEYEFLHDWREEVEEKC
uniref:Uncharacterized protein n=1 Tax=Vitis vinifera TaxID=29760 RepID=A5ALM1_VITVI|nr:hypothetical protein VITISV_001218 [Vitis vinifera]